MHCLRNRPNFVKKKSQQQNIVSQTLKKVIFIWKYTILTVKHSFTEKSFETKSTEVLRNNLNWLTWTKSIYLARYNPNGFLWKQAFATEICIQMKLIKKLQANTFENMLKNFMNIWWSFHASSCYCRFAHSILIQFSWCVKSDKICNGIEMVTKYS